MSDIQCAAHPWLTRPKDIGSIISEETCDIVVIGAGIAGCTAAQAASSAGASVIVCEKFATYTAHGIDIGSVGTKVQKSMGVEIDKALAARLIYEWGQQQANYYLILKYV
jgi:glycine/D-amino acid oxidase-like deaminating enzyme